jgi:hypothetical protein
MLILYLSLLGNALTLNRVSQMRFGESVVWGGSTSDFIFISLRGCWIAFIVTHCINFQSNLLISLYSRFQGNFDSRYMTMNHYN